MATPNVRRNVDQSKTEFVDEEIRDYALIGATE